MKLYNYYRSSASYRVRIVAAIKGIDYEYVSIDLSRGESRAASFESLNPQGRVPTLEENGKLVGQSLAICEYLEETHPNPPMLPRDPAGRARVRALALAVACEIHPIGGGRAQSIIAKFLPPSVSVNVSAAAAHLCEEQAGDDRHQHGPDQAKRRQFATLAIHPLIENGNSDHL
jgi:maleylacetoacetate isomerase